jgi:phosphatidylglycerophosphate synthase
MFDGRWRTAVDRTTGPVGKTLHRHGITADVLTATGLVSASATAVLVASGHFHLAILFLIITGMHDLFDGPVAKAAGTASVRGAFFDSVTDRIADAVLMFGCAWYLLDRGDGHLALLPMGILAVTALVSYERAKAESLGLSAKVGNAAAGRDAVIRRRIEAWREGRVDSRWRAWREARESTGVPRRELARTTGAPVGRWRARRQESLSSRSGRTLRDRRRAARGHSGTTGARRTTRRTPPAA